MALNVTQTPIVNRNGFDSFWVSVFNPINFSVSNTKFPINQESDSFNINSFSNNNGLLKLTLNTDADYIDGEIIELSNANLADYNTTARIIDVIDSRNIVVNLNYSDQLTSGTIQKVFQDYEIVYRVSAGLPPSHKWVSIKPFEEIGVTSSKPDNDNVASIDIKDFVQEQIQTNKS